MREFEAKVADTPLPAWRGIGLGHGFHETRQGTRFTISPQARDDVLDKLLALNFYRHEQEARQVRHTAKKKTRKPANTPPKILSSNPPLPIYNSPSTTPTKRPRRVHHHHDGALIPQP
jgi:hypothetical protein